MAKAKRPRRRSDSDLSDGQKRVLLRGQMFLRIPAWSVGSGIGRRAKFDLEAIESAWAEHRDDLLPAWIAEHPGTRPWAWWKFDAPEPSRRLLRGSDIRDDLTDWESRLSAGIVRVFGLKEDRSPPVWESEAAYLDRHKLLKSVERKAIGDFDREESSTSAYVDRVNATPLA